MVKIFLYAMMIILSVSCHSIAETEHNKIAKTIQKYMTRCDFRFFLNFAVLFLALAHRIEAAISEG